MPVAESLSKLTLIFSSEHTYSKQLSTSVSMKLKQSLHLFLSYSMAQSSPHGNAVPVGYVYFNFVDDIIFSYNGLEPKTTHMFCLVHQAVALGQNLPSPAASYDQETKPLQTQCSPNDDSSLTFKTNSSVQAFQHSLIESDNIRVSDVYGSPRAFVGHHKFSYLDTI